MMLGLLAGCSETGNGDAATRAGGSTGLAAVGGRAIERDIEAPEIFSMEEPGLWDGRPSLGGVWVAHPEATNPERVMIRNQQTGETVVGALFRRERENPGPRFQISSEAANALNILPGQPTTVSVVALQLQRIEPEPARAEPEAASTEAEDTARDAPTLADGSADAAEQPAQTAAAPAQAETVDEPRGLRRLFSRRSDPRDGADSGESADIAVTALPDSTAPPSARDAAQSATATATATASAAAEARPAPRERRGLGALFSRGDRASQPEDSPQADALIPLPEDTPRDGVLSPLAASTPATPPASTLDRPFVQIGIFSVEANATGARERMQRAGLDAEIRRGQVNDNLFWRVVVGPAQDRTGQAAILEQVRAMGFGDAYTVAR